ncbi:MAG: hypothetical protein KDD64_14470 [Bdellovibrionales bacterium]|nr:hypothetical protein [Bdellovibrionales bacterium]
MLKTDPAEGQCAAQVDTNGGGSRREKPFIESAARTVALSALGGATFFTTTFWVLGRPKGASSISYHPLPKAAGFSPELDYTSQFFRSLSSLKEGLVNTAPTRAPGGDSIAADRNQTQTPEGHLLRKTYPVSDREGAIAYLSHLATLLDELEEPHKYLEIGRELVFNLKELGADTKQLENTVYQGALERARNVEEASLRSRALVSVLRVAHANGAATESIFDGVTREVEETLKQVSSYAESIAATNEDALPWKNSVFTDALPVLVTLAIDRDDLGVAQELTDDYLAIRSNQERLNSNDQAILTSLIERGDESRTTRFLQILQSGITLHPESASTLMNIPDPEDFPALAALSQANQEGYRALFQAVENNLAQPSERRAASDKAFAEGDFEKAREKLIQMVDEFRSQYPVGSASDYSFLSAASWLTSSIGESHLMRTLASQDGETNEAVQAARELVGLIRNMELQDSPLPEKGAHPSDIANSGPRGIARLASVAMDLDDEFLAREILRDAWQFANAAPIHGAPIFFVDEFPERVTRDDERSVDELVCACGAHHSPSKEDDYNSLRAEAFLELANYADLARCTEERDYALHEAKVAALSIGSNFSWRMERLSYLIDSYTEFGMAAEAQALLPEFARTKEISERLNEEAYPIISIDVQLATGDYTGAIDSLTNGLKAAQGIGRQYTVEALLKRQVPYAPW